MQTTRDLLPIDMRSREVSDDDDTDGDHGDDDDGSEDVHDDGNH